MRKSQSREQKLEDALRRIVAPFSMIRWPHIPVAIRKSEKIIWITGAVDDEMYSSIRYAQKLLRLKL